MPYQRIRDPLHDLIEFSSSELERTLWKVVQTRPFQRLRRVKQLGFSDLVYPGASHSRFAHSIGVFHTARQLMAVVRRHVDQESKEKRALAAALVHDLGHGPFSHAFEEVGTRLGLKLADHENMSDALIRQSEVSMVLNELGSGFANDVADIIKKDGIKTVQHAVVSSQFDSDRLDYMRRDRLMTGTQHAAIDFTWLIANLEIGSVAVGVDDTPLGTIETFVLGPKAIHAAEAFVLGLFQLYPTVYFHKATRGAEKIFTELLVRVVTLVREGMTSATGLSANHPLVRFALNPDDIDVALMLDDAVIWGALTQMSEATDPLVAEFSTRLRDRVLYKCHDIRMKVAHVLDPKSENTDELIELIDKCCARIGTELAAWVANNCDARPRILIDYDERSPYKSVNESKGPLDRINIRTDSGALVDLKERSSVVAALKTFKLFRAYADGSDADACDTIKRIIEGEIKTCRTQTLERPQG
ncbi:MAG: HD domain-containing protein [Beijerinckiaceae bacterium]